MLVFRVARAKFASSFHYRTGRRTPLYIVVLLLESERTLRERKLQRGNIVRQIVWPSSCYVKDMCNQPSEERQGLS